MAKLILLDTRLFVGAADLSGQSNKLEITDEIEAKDVTNFRSGGAKELLGGLESVQLEAEGQWEAGDPGKIDDQVWADRRAIVPWTAGATNASDAGTGSVAYLTQALRTKVKLFDAVGEVAPWSASATGSWPLVRGQMAHPSGTARTATGNGTGLNLGAVAAGRRLYASLHVLSVSGTSTPTITVEVQSDSDNTFASAATVISFAAATAAGGQILRTGGSAITDTWFRVIWTITGTTPSFLFLAALGIE